MKRNGPILSLTSILLYCFMYTPIVVVAIFSFNASKYGVAWKGFTTKWYGVLFNNEQALRAAENTLILASASAAIATLLGTLLGYGLSRYWFPRKKFVATLMYVPVVIPDILMAVALLMFYGLMRDALGIFELGLSTMIFAHITFQIAFVAVVVKARMVGMDPALEEAARDLGANRWNVFWRITFPLMFPGIMSGALLAFTLSLDDFVVSFFTSGPGSTTLPILIYSSVKRGITPDINALSTLMVCASVLLVAGVTALQPRKNYHEK
ncbi:MAG: ABC transporter permease subunit [Oligoflexia bacterium]|nr:ABC transporter permease subunit [Oligoflexia bacterium]